MTKIKKLSLILLSTLLFVCSAFIFVGCDNDDDTCKLYVFATKGGYVQVGDSAEHVEFGDEGSKIFTFKEDSTVKLKAVANAGYQFVKWQYSEGLEQTFKDGLHLSEFDLLIDEDEMVVKAVFAVDGSVARYNITYPTNTTGYTITPLAGYTTSVIEGGNFKFTVALLPEYSQSNIVVKANGTVLTASEDVYTVSNISAETTITVEGVVLNPQDPVDPQPTTKWGIFTQDTRFSIVPVGQSTCEVEDGQSFTFTIQLTDATKYKFGDSVVVKAGSTILVSNNGEYTGAYTINSITQNIEITVEGIEEIVEGVTYVFTLDFEETAKSIVPSIVYSVPTSITFTISDEDKKAEYTAADFKVFDDNGNEMSIKDIIDAVNEAYSLSTVSQFTIGGLQFIGINGNNISVNWALLNVTSNIYDLVIVM